MKRRNKLWLMGGILGLTLILTLGVFFMNWKVESIRESGETILTIPPDSVTSLSWDHQGETLTFRKEEQWQYAGDKNFPVSGQDLQNILDPFESLTASFAIQEVEDYSQYGFDAPVCTIHIATEEESYEIRLGSYSQMDQQRYVDIGDGNVYLLFHDPMMEFDVGLRDVIQNDDIPYLDEADQITLEGPDSYKILRNPEGGKSHREEDLYFAARDGKLLPLATSSVKDYLSSLALVGLSNYQTYTASQEDLSKYGLDKPELSILVDYTLKEEDSKQEEKKSYTLHIARDPEMRKEAEAAEDPDSLVIPVYARVGDSQLVYEITPADYEALSACSYNDLRHQDIFPASTEDITAMDITLDGTHYRIQSQPDEEEEDNLIFTYKDQEVDLTHVLTALRSLHAEEFTEEAPADRREISMDILLFSEETVSLELYRQDGTHCLARVDGQVVAQIPRTQAVELMEQIRTIVLSPVEKSMED